MGGPPAHDLETEPEAEGFVGPGSPAAEHPGLVVVYSSEGWEHVGAWLPLAPSDLGRPRILGRGVAQAEDEYPRLRPLRQRPSVSETLPDFENRSLSRVQLLVRSAGPRTLHVTNVGRCRCSVNGTETKELDVHPGDVVELGSQLVMVCALRPAKLAGAPADARHAFGRADARGFVGESPPAWRLRAQVAAVAPRSGHAIIFGATGTGKELVAHALHRLSGRTGVLLSRNAATLPETLVDAELFGNLKGYPNPGMPDRKGLIGAADGGTLFLDEFAELPLEAQAHVLRALDSGEYQRLGETTLRRSQFRLIAATNRPESALRDDLLARFDFRIALASLSERSDDIPFIARHLFREMSEEAPEVCKRFAYEDGDPRLGAELVTRLVRHPFRMNVRELRSLLWSSLHDSEGEWLGWPRAVAEHPAAAAAADDGDDDDDASAASLRASEVERVLGENGGSIEKSWRTLGLTSRFALMRLLKKHGISVKKDVKRG
jgi:two-component system nitrogen regulation response regulator GlnG/two-component system response regulator HydG